LPLWASEGIRGEIRSPGRACCTTLDGLHLIPGSPADQVLIGRPDTAAPGAAGASFVLADSVSHWSLRPPVWRPLFLGRLCQFAPEPNDAKREGNKTESLKTRRRRRFNRCGKQGGGFVDRAPVRIVDAFGGNGRDMASQPKPAVFSLLRARSGGKGREHPAAAPSPPNDPTSSPAGARDKKLRPRERRNAGDRGGGAGRAGEGGRRGRWYSSTSLRRRGCDLPPLPVNSRRPKAGHFWRPVRGGAGILRGLRCGKRGVDVLGSPRDRPRGCGRGELNADYPRKVASVGVVRGVVGAVGLHSRKIAGDVGRPVVGVRAAEGGVRALAGVVRASGGSAGGFRGVRRAAVGAA